MAPNRNIHTVLYNEIIKFKLFLWGKMFAVIKTTARDNSKQLFSFSYQELTDRKFIPK